MVRPTTRHERNEGKRDGQPRLTVGNIRGNNGIPRDQFGDNVSRATG
jgi:hypothetical protein